uniref:Mitochondrial import receptor subunit TOM40 n=1 Tax=Heterosigma akashiwo TaxID=2829 RepID=A0A6V1K0T5_HETAK|mmetsp:Transcript_36870/g.53966  ORF Transcript_36870/g.53966 Transcript_36870/m.53966 type:complete len:330 (+) Transcript_36870:87-1076(+)
MSFLFKRMAPGIARCDAPSSNADAEKDLPNFLETEEKPELVKQAEAAEKGAEEKIRCPPPLEFLPMEFKRITQPDTYDGVRFELNKPVTPSFGINHMFWLGTQMIPTHVHYTYGATVAEDSDRLIMGRYDLQGNLDSRIHYAWNKQFNSKFLMGLGQQDSASADLSYAGASATWQAKAAALPAPQLALSYVQALTPRWAAGGEAVMNLKANRTLMSGVCRYANPHYTAAVLVAQNGEAVACHYLRQVAPNRVALAAELVLQPLALESQVTFGAEFSLKQSKLITCIDGSGKISTLVETMLSPACKLTFSGEMLHSKDVYKFGYGMSIGG